MTIEGLKPGRIVYYRDGEDQIPSIVTFVYEDGESIDCTSFHRGGERYHSLVPFHPDGSLEHWSWMFEGQATRYQPNRVEAKKEGV